MNEEKIVLLIGGPKDGLRWTLPVGQRDISFNIALRPKLIQEIAAREFCLPGEIVSSTPHYYHQEKFLFLKGESEIFIHNSLSPHEAFLRLLEHYHPERREE